MPDRPINGDDAQKYIEHVGQHGLHEDTKWLIETGRFPVGCHVLDVGCGTGALIAALAQDKRYVRNVRGLELSPQLAEHARRAVAHTGALVEQADFLTWTAPTHWRPDTAVMAFVLHHTADSRAHLRRAASLLPHGGRLYIFDRVAIDQTALDQFPRFWEDKYRQAHQWHEEMPRLMTVEGLTRAAQESGFDLVRRTVCPNDHRVGTEGFPKTLMEFWRHEGGRTFPAVLVVSPAHQNHLQSIKDQLASNGLPVSEERQVPYSDELISTFYERCPWRAHLIDYVHERCPVRVATAMRIGGDFSSAALLDRLCLFKQMHRDRWESDKGPVHADELRAIILPFHVAEPYEAEALAELVGLRSQGRLR